MKDKVRVSFDVPINEHTFLKSECARQRISLRDLMQEIFHKTYEEVKKNGLQNMRDKYETS